MVTILLVLIAGTGSVAGSGSILAMVQTASQRTPDIICGKPNKPMFDVLVSKYNIDSKRTLMIGDRLVSTHLFLSILFAYGFAFSALTLLVGSQEEHPACKN